MTNFELFSGGKILHSNSIGAEPVGFSFSIEETTGIGFQVTDFDGEADYQVAIGDMPISDDCRMILMDKVVWKQQKSYIDGASGYTVISLSDKNTNAVLARINIYVEPSKLSRAAYRRMVTDIGQISTELLLDLLSKSRTSVAHDRLATNTEILPPTARLELCLIMDFWRRFSVTLSTILEEPNKRILHVPTVRQINHRDRANHRVMRTLAQRGWSPRRAIQRRMFHELQTPQVTHDTIENQTLTSFLELLLRQVLRCVTLISRERYDRMNGITNFKEIDWQVYHFIKRGNRPKIRKLENRIDVVEGLIRQIRSTIRRHKVKAKRLTRNELMANLETPVFLHDSRYSLAASQMKIFMQRSGVALKIGEDEGAKTISRIYEQWVYFQICDALTASGLSCISHKSVFETIRRDRYSVDIDRNSALTFESEHGQLVRLRYEPTIFPLSVAKDMDTIFRGLSEAPSSGPKRAPWTPDIVMEVHEPVEHTIGYRLSYAVVVDAKYTTNSYRLEDYIGKIRKYEEIRSVETNQQIVRQLWVAAPFDPSISPNDESVAWSKDGKISTNSTDIIRGVLGIDPGNVDATRSTLVAYILGTLDHARRYFRDSAYSSSTIAELPSNLTSETPENGLPRQP